jgi:1-acyl-sn-glycerol-3-phosphate acyltransferase
MDTSIPPFAVSAQSARYRLPRPGLAGFVASALLLRPRSFARDAQRAVAGLPLPPQVLGGEQIPPQGPGLIVCNHYTRPGFPAWWLVLAISAAAAAHRHPQADPQIHWVMTAAWTFPGSPWRRRLLSPLTRFAFDRVARTYGFVTMPAMPPDPAEVEARAWAVRRTVRLARHLAATDGLLGLAPEGQDTPGGLGQPPAGAGEFMALLVQAGLPLLPVGVSETAGRLCISFGPLFEPDIPPRHAGQDQAVARQVMAAVARQLP